MKIVAIVCILVLGSASAATLNQQNLVKLPQRVELGGLVEDVLNKWIGVLAEFDPMDISIYSIDIFGFKFLVKNVHIEGFANIVPEVSLDVGGEATTLKLSLSQPKLVESIEHWESNFPVGYGNGTANFEIDDFSVSINVVYSNGFQPSTVVTKVGNAKVQITGIHNDEALSEQISDAANNFYNVIVNSPEFHTKLAERLDKFLSSLLN